MRSQSLAYFLEIAECGSFTQAAKKLYVSQQGLSKSIKSLEKDLGCRLFHRDGSQLRLTSAGHMLVPYARQCLRDVEMLREAMEPFGRMASPRRREAEEQKTTLHAMAFVSNSLFSLLEDELKRAGLHDVHVIEHSYSEIMRELEEDSTPALYGLCLPERDVPALSATPHVVFRPLFVTEIMLVGSSQFVHADKGPFSREKIAKLPVVYYNDSLLNVIICEMFQDQPLENVLTHASSLSRISQFIEQGKAVSFSDSLSVFLSEPDDRVAYAPIEGASRFVMGFAYRDDVDVPLHSLDYLEAFAECFRSRCAPYLVRFPL